MLMIMVLHLTLVKSLLMGADFFFLKKIRIILFYPSRNYLTKVDFSLMGGDIGKWSVILDFQFFMKKGLFVNVL